MCWPSTVRWGKGGMRSSGQVGLYQKMVGMCPSPQAIGQDSYSLYVRCGVYDASCTVLA